MVENKFIVEKLIEFHKIVDALVNIEVKIEDGDNTLLWFSSLPTPFENFKDALGIAWSFWNLRNL